VLCSTSFEKDLLVGFLHEQSRDVGGNGDEEDTPLSPTPSLVLGGEATDERANYQSDMPVM
jgi:hypothetical protein